MSKKKYKNIITVVLVFVIFFWGTLIDWNNFLSKSNSGAILGVLAPLIIIIALHSKSRQDNINS